MTTLQVRRHTELLEQIERAVHRREKVIASLVRATNNIAAMARQARRYEKIIAKPAAPVAPAVNGGKRPAKEIARPLKRVRLRHKR